MSAVRFDGVSFTYPDETRPVLHDVSLDIEEGAFVLVVGPTGSGKSTLLRAVNGLVPHFSGGTFSGQVRVAGRDTIENAPRQLSDVVAFVPQDPGSSFVLDRVEDELAYAMENLGVDESKMRRRVEETLDALDIASLRDRSVRTLSGGEKQRVAIAAALTPGARVLILDEPTSQLDPQGAEDVLAALQRLVHDLGYTVLAAEHRLERIAGFGDVAIGLLGDASVRVGDPASIFAQLSIGPPVAKLGAALGWDPVPLTVRDARRAATGVLLPKRPADQSAADKEVLLRARSLDAGYDGTRVLKQVDLELRRGEVVALVGRNGSGKTTLLRCLAGLHSPSRGSVTALDAVPIPGRSVALSPQVPETVLFKERVDDEIGVGTKGAASVEALLERFDLGGLRHRHPRDLSSGQRLLVAIAAIAATEAPVFLLDEPTRGLDPESKKRLALMTRTFASQGNAILFATHDVELVAEVADRVVMLASGEVIADGDTRVVIGDSTVFAPQTARVFGPEWLTPDDVVAAART